MDKELVTNQPLAARLRPQALEQFIGQAHLLSPNKPLWNAWQRKTLHSMILWGPPGTGKTTLAKLLAANVDANIEIISAVLAGVKDLREIVARAKCLREEKNIQTVLFVDEIHRFNKAQQDAFLPHVEEGSLILIGATTENPSFELNNALLSRVKVYVLKHLQNHELRAIIQQALTNSLGFPGLTISFPEELQQKLVQASDGDARCLLNLLELAVSLAEDENGLTTIDESVLTAAIGNNLRRFDKGGDLFYDQISALHKSVRGSSPDGALYWFARMLDAGCDPLYIARRVIRMATEDIGNADPRGVQIALNAWDVQQRLGSPEGELAIAQAISYLACAAKSNAVYNAFKQAQQDVKLHGTLEVPLHLRNAPTKLLKELKHGKEYRYDHDTKEAFARGQTYFPEALGERHYYHPVERGLEIKIKEKLDCLRQD